MKRIILSFIVFITLSSKAEYVLEWEYNFENNYPQVPSSYQIGDINYLSDGVLAVFLHNLDYINPDAAGAYVCFLRNDGYMLNYYYIPEGFDGYDRFTPQKNRDTVILNNRIWTVTDDPFVFNYQELTGDYIFNYQLDNQSKHSIFGHKNSFYLRRDSSITLCKFTNTNVNQNVLSSHTSSGFNQDNYVINWDSSSGAQYQIQSSTDLTNWVDVGSALIGTGDMMTWANHVTNSQAFYRVVEE